MVNVCAFAKRFGRNDVNPDYRRVLFFYLVVVKMKEVSAGHVTATGKVSETLPGMTLMN